MIVSVNGDCHNNQGGRVHKDAWQGLHKTKKIYIIKYARLLKISVIKFYVMNKT